MISRSLTSSGTGFGSGTRTVPGGSLANAVGAAAVLSAGAVAGAGAEAVSAGAAVSDIDRCSEYAFIESGNGVLGPGAELTTRISVSRIGLLPDAGLTTTSA